jgi:signal transduction histidine kinase
VGEAAARVNGGGGGPNGMPIGRRLPGGHGIDGLAERARLVNGTIEAGAVADGGYRLAVTVPVAPA